MEKKAQQSEAGRGDNWATRGSLWWRRRLPANVEIRYWQPETKHMREAKCLGVGRPREMKKVRAREREEEREVDQGN